MSKLNFTYSNSPVTTNLVTWASLKGIRWWGKVCISEGNRGRGLFAARPISAYEFVLAVPITATFSIVNFERDRSFPLRVSPHDFGQILPWWPDLDWGSFSLLAWLTREYVKNSPEVASYLNALPKTGTESNVLPPENPACESFYVLRQVAKQAMRSKSYRDTINDVVLQCDGISSELFDLNLMWLYTMLRSRSIPVWSRNGTGHSYFQSSIYAQDQSSRGGDISCMVPMLDLVNHSHKPNTSVGFPDQGMVQYLKSEGRVPSSDIIVLQAQSEIAVGEELLMDYNTFHDFDSDLFRVWYDTEQVDQASALATTNESAALQEKKKIPKRIGKGKKLARPVPLAAMIEVEPSQGRICFDNFGLEEVDEWPEGVQKNMTAP